VNADTKMWKEVAGFLDEGTGMTGELHFTGRLRLDGEFHGSIFTDGTLVVGEKASVRGDIKVSEIEIAGHIFGNIEASTRVEILDTGRVQGDVQTPLLVMKPGSMLDGRTSMDSLTPYTPTDQADN
jgi:cytoskeletal protein CcmA (bactofilin family)